MMADTQASTRTMLRRVPLCHYHSWRPCCAAGHRTPAFATQDTKRRSRHPIIFTKQEPLNAERRRVPLSVVILQECYVNPWKCEGVATVPGSPSCPRPRPRHRRANVCSTHVSRQIHSPWPCRTPLCSVLQEEPFPTLISV